MDHGSFPVRLLGLPPLPSRPLSGPRELMLA